MFTWICPQCGREVPPSYTECPDCAKKAAEPKPDPAAPVEPQAAPPQSPAPPAAPVYRAPAPPARGGVPTWAMAILFAFAMFGLVAGVYWLVGAARSGKPTAAVESPAAKPGAKTNPYQKYVEISGVRFTEDARKRTQVRFVLVNHSNADIPGLAGNVTVWGRTRNSEEDAAGTFTFKTDLKAYESKDMTELLNTKLKIYELPDWQNISTDIQVISPL